jgi:hypothetical protein
MQEGKGKSTARIGCATKPSDSPGRRFKLVDDHWVRSSAEFDRIQSYIERNPVSAQLVSKPEAWPWSSAAQITDDFPAQTSSSCC